MTLEYNKAINATPEAIWDMLTHPRKVAEYMYNARPESTWENGAEVKFTMPIKGKTATVVHGKITNAEKPHILEHSLFPTLSELEDIPENHIWVRYSIEKQAENCNLKIEQWGFDTAADGAQRFKDASTGWDMIMDKMKEIAERD